MFTRSGSTWTQQGPKLTGSGESGAGEFGCSVALSADGNTALIGGFARQRPTLGRRGCSRARARPGPSRAQSSPAAGRADAGQFGGSVALSADGNTALIGGHADNSNVGAAWVFTRSGSTWTQQGPKLTGSGEIGAGYFGVSVALSADGNTALIGGPGDNSGVGAAWVFTRSGSTWTQQGRSSPAAARADTATSATSVALSSDGNTALIGGSDDNGAVGAAWVFTRSGSTWTQQGPKLTGSGERSEQAAFGNSVALSADGNTALIGGPGDNSEASARRGCS